MILFAVNCIDQLRGIIIKGRSFYQEERPFDIYNRRCEKSCKIHYRPHGTIYRDNLYPRVHFRRTEDLQQVTVLIQPYLTAVICRQLYSQCLATP